jgi:GxxExxY protein
MPNVESRKAGKWGELGNSDLSGRVIEAAIAVHSSLGPGFLESVYEKALAVELEARGIAFERQKVIHVRHRDVPVGEHRLDFLVEGVLLVEMKAVAALDPVFFVVARSQMRAAGIVDGIILNFASMPLTIKRVGPGRYPDS